MVLLSYILTALVAYFLGSIPTGYLVAKARGVDIRTVGSGNIGATNVFRILGKPAGIFVLLADAGKGFVGCLFAGQIVVRLLKPEPPPDLEWLRIVGGFFAIIGHNYTCWLKFKGGKGIATSAGAVLALLPKALGVSLATWILVLGATRYVSVASMIAAFILPFAAWFFGRNPRMIAVAAVIGALAIYKHRSNIQRLLSGTEHRVGQKKEAAK